MICVVSDNSCVALVCFRNTGKYTIHCVFETSGPDAAVLTRSHDYRKVVQPMLIWILIFFTRPHKVHSYSYNKKFRSFAQYHEFCCCKCCLPECIGGEILVPHLPTVVSLCCHHSSPTPCETCKYWLSKFFLAECVWNLWNGWKSSLNCIIHGGVIGCFVFKRQGA